MYEGINDVNLLRDIVIQSGKCKVKKHEWTDKGTTGTVGAACVITLTNPKVFVDDYYNSMELFIVDDNSVLCSATIADSAANTSVTIDTTAALKESDGATAGTFTNATEYDCYIRGAEKFLGYSDQQLDYEEETIDFNTGDIPRKRIRRDTLGVVSGFSGNIRSFGAEILKEVLGLTEYGSQTGQKQFHGGSTPAVRDEWSCYLEMDNVKGHNWIIQFFKGQFFSTGAINTSEEGYKIIPYAFNANIDTLRDSDEVNTWKIIQKTS